MNKLFPIVLALLFFGCGEEKNELTKLLDEYESFCSTNTVKGITSMSNTQLDDFQKIYLKTNPYIKLYYLNMIDKIFLLAK